MKKIIIPTCCQSAFTNLFQLATTLFPNDPIHCRFLQIHEIPNNYNDLLTISRSGKKTSFDPAFIKTITELKQNYGHPITFDTDDIYGDAPAVFRNYVRHNQCDMIIYYKQEWQESKIKNRLDVFRMVSRSGCELVYVSETAPLIQHEPVHHYNKNGKDKKTIQAPASILHQYYAVEERLDTAHNTLYNKQIISKKFSHLSRYFLNENLLQKFLLQTEASLLLIKTNNK